MFKKATENLMKVSSGDGGSDYFKQTGGAFVKLRVSWQ